MLLLTFYRELPKEIWAITIDIDSLMSTDSKNIPKENVEFC